MCTVSESFGSRTKFDWFKVKTVLFAQICQNGGGKCILVLGMDASHRLYQTAELHADTFPG
jgi:hypothetical protein